MMTSTAITLSADQQRRLAVGHNDRLASVSNWDLPTLAGGGALRSTANDMLTFVAANLGAMPSSLMSAMSAMLADRRSTGMPGIDVALAWHIFTRNGDEIIWHNGGTGGYRSFIGFSPRTKVGVVVLSNTSTSAGIDDIGLHVLDARLPLVQPPKPHAEVTVDPNLFDGYVGAYQLAPNFVLTVTREANRLFIQATGQPRFEIFAEGPKEYFLKVVDAQLSFVTNAAGQATAVILHQNGANVTGQRIN
jgi:CubicO group peptidase (beta-lactamase class C family)